MQSEAAAQFEIFPWNRTFETGIEPVDRQHRQLVDLLNRLASHLGRCSGQIELNQVFSELADYAEFHFKEEEAVWLPYFDGGDWFVGHRNAHDSFMAKVSELKEGDSSRALDEVIEDILRFLTRWLALHILDSDMRMAKALHGMESGLPIEQAKAKADLEMQGSMEVLIETLLNMYDILSTRSLEMMREREERKKIEAALYASEKREKAFSDAVTNSVPGLLYLFDERLRLVRWNRRFEEMTGYGDSDLAGCHLLDFFVEEDHQDVLEKIQDIRKKGYVEDEGKLRTRDGRVIPFLFTAVPMEIERDAYFSGIGIEITALKHAEAELEQKAQMARDALVGVVGAVSKALEARDPYTAGHQQRVARIAVEIAGRMGLDEDRVEGIRLGASIHDIGKLAVPVDLLTKPSRLNALEYALIQSHTQSGLKILKGVSFPWPIAEIVSQHHERLDGSGYPAGLKRDGIVLEARIVAVADVFEAMSAHRPYRAALGTCQAMEELKAHRSTLYEAEAVDALLSLLEEDENRFQA